MIRVFIVEDEKLVRQGIIGLFDWEKYDMEVVGDAGSGEEAVAFLRKKGADLLLTDMEMPGLSGIDFLKAVKAVLPDIRIVVLTMHQEFELIQQALRVGVLDYITKAQIEEDNPDALMEGVRRRYLEAVRQSGLAQRYLERERAFIWRLEDEGLAREAESFLSGRGFPFEMLDERHYLLLENTLSPTREQELEAFGRESLLLTLLHVRGLSLGRLKESLYPAIENRIFADFLPGRFSYSYDYGELEEKGALSGQKEPGDFWTGMEFMTDADCFERGLEKICRSALTAEERIIFFYRFNLHWAEFSGKDITRYFQEVNGFKWWYQWKKWCGQIRGLVLERVGNPGEELRNVEEIHRAMNYIREHMDREIALNDLLHLTGMSKSHFSKNFKKVTGRTFVSYLNDIRIETAKKYLRETGQPISWIAAQVGFGDEHYFRKVFKRCTDVSPRVFREKNQDCISEGDKSI